ncbi:MAG TPA: cysteine desulfurase family protein, partial [Pyrinomonadaceae bacterium]|nr:cysteine desulfurase family protein [Pyrinomonadaceae bacterium]
MRKVYLDHSATTPIDSRVLEAMLPYLTEKFGNASSVHGFGQEARAAVDKARRQIASLIGARANEIVFTSGGTEANNLAIRGICEAAEIHGRHVITSAIEHPSVRGVIDQLERDGWEITRLPVYEDGIVRIDDVRAAIRRDTILISVMMANNEIGTIQPVMEIGELVSEERKRGHRHLWFHTDAVQAAGRLSIDVQALGCDLLSLSAHKIYAPKGTGALFIRRGVRLLPQQVGGHQERERRAGTESVANIVAFGVAAELTQKEMNERNDHTRRLRDRFETEVERRITNIVFNGNREQ